MVLKVIPRLKFSRQSAVGFIGGLFLIIEGAGAQGIDLRGRVIDTAGRPVINAKIELFGKNHLDSTNDEGYFSITSSVRALRSAQNTSNAKSSFTLKGNRLVFETSQKTGFEFELFSLNGRRLYQLKKSGLAAGTHWFASPFEKICQGLYVVRINYPEYRRTETKSLLKSNNQLTVTIPQHTLSACFAKTASVVDTLMIYKRGFKIVYKPIDTPVADLGDITLHPAESDKNAYIIFIRGDVSSDTLPATAGWVYDPVSKAFVKKHDFEKSSWAPNLLLWEEPAKAPCYVRHQVPAAIGSAYGYTVTLYKMDYTTGNAIIVAHSDQIIGLGANPQLVYLSTDKGHWILDRQTDRIDTMEKFNLISMVNDLWVINHDKNDSAFLFSTQENRVIANIYSQMLFTSNDRYVISNGHRFMAQYKAVMGGIHYGQTVLVQSEIILFNFEKDSAYAFPMAVYCSGGSGVPIIYRTLEVNFSGDSCLHYISAINENDSVDRTLSDSALLRRCELISVNLQTGAVTKQPAPETRSPPFTLQYVPPYLESLRGKILSNEQLIQAFLGNCGFPEEISYDVGISPDGKRFLGRFYTISVAGDYVYEFIYGDMENKWAQRLLNPPEALIDPFAEIYIYGIDGI